jgi:hypothetical protein
MIVRCSSVMESDKTSNIDAHRRKMNERERRVNNFKFRPLVHLFLNDKKMDTVDSHILDGSPPQRLIVTLILSINKKAPWPSRIA